MALLERVSTLVRANLTTGRQAEHPKNDQTGNPRHAEQLLQVKTQVAIAMADQHLLEQSKRK